MGAAWIGWAAFLISVGAAYQTTAKVLSNKLPVFLSTAVIGATVMVLSLFALALSNQPVPALRDVSTKTWLTVLLVATLTFCIEMGYLMLYRSGAPLSLARLVMLAGTALLLLAIGIFAFGEHLSRTQFLGIAAILFGLALLTMK